MAQGEFIPLSTAEEQIALGRFAASRPSSPFHDLDSRFSDLIIGNAFTTNDPNRVEIRYGDGDHSLSLTLPLSELEIAMPEFAARAREVIARVAR